MGTSVGTWSELQLCSSYLSCPGNYIVQSRDSNVRALSDGGQGNCIQPVMMGGGAGGESEREGVSAANWNAFCFSAFKACLHIWNKYVEFSFLFLLPGQESLLPILVVPGHLTASGKQRLPFLGEGGSYEKSGFDVVNDWNQWEEEEKGKGTFKRKPRFNMLLEMIYIF